LIISYLENGYGTTAHYYPNFIKIKSLYNSTSCTTIPNQPAVSVPLCQIKNIPVSFSNVPWGMSPNDDCFGTISSYEYLLPVGWKIGNTVSDGSSWIPEGNSVTVTSDLSHGANGYIQFRPRIDCAGGLLNGTTPGVIPILRTGPNMTITGSTDYICSGSTNYTVNGLPPGATVQWNLSDYTNAQIGCGSCSTVTVTRNTTVDVSVVLTATVTDCITYPAITKTIRLGKPSIDESKYVVDGIYYPIKLFNGYASDYNQLCVGHTATTQFSIPGATNVSWTRTFASPTNTYWWQNGDEIQL